MHYIRTVYTVQENIQLKLFCKINLFYRVLYSTDFSLQAEYVLLSSFLFIRIPQQQITFFGLVNCIFQRIFPFLLRAESIKHTRNDKYKTQSNTQKRPETWF